MGKLNGRALCFALDAVFSACAVGTTNWSIVRKKQPNEERDEQDQEDEKKEESRITDVHLFKYLPALQ